MPCCYCHAILFIHGVRQLPLRYYFRRFHIALDYAIRLCYAAIALFRYAIRRFRHIFFEAMAIFTRWFYATLLSPLTLLTTYYAI